MEPWSRVKAVGMSVPLPRVSFQRHAVPLKLAQVSDLLPDLLHQIILSWVLCPTTLDTGEVVAGY